MNDESIFTRALELQGRPEQRDFLAQACHGDTNLLQNVESLLHAHARGAFLEAPLPGIAATLDMPTLPEPPGTQIGPYKLREQIGEGGFGVVYVAEQEKPVARKVALKIIKPGMDTREVIARFEAERQALALMDHPNIAKVLDAGTTGGNPKSEIRNPKESRSKKSESQKPVADAASIRADAGSVRHDGVSDIDASNLELPSDFAAVEFEQGRDSNFRPQGRPYFVMELVRGVPITEFCDERKLNTRERLQLFIDVCRAVQHAHQKGIIHRDLKPSNVMVTLHDDKAVVKVIDFGISKALSSKLTEKTIYTAYGQMVGTPLYMSPEQAQFTGLDVDTRSDVYSLGVLLYELLTGTTPFDKETLQKSSFDEMRRIIREVEPPRPSARISTLNAELLSTVSARHHIDPRKLSQSLRGELDWIVMKALEKDRGRRYETASGFAADVERYLHDEPVLACPPSVWYRFRKFARRKKSALTISTVVALAVLLVVGSMGWMVRDRAAREQRVARDRDARHAAIEQEANVALKDAERLLGQRNYRDALSSTKRAEGILAGGGSDELRGRVREMRKDVEMALRLEGIRFERHVVNTGTEDDPRSEATYAKVFRDYGIDVQTLPPQEAAARIRARRIWLELVLGLDDWLLVGSWKTHLDSWKALLALARAADPDPWRNRLRETLQPQKRKAVLRKLAAADNPRNLATANLFLLNHSPTIADAPELVISVMRQAREHNPSDFWVNLGLAYSLNKLNPPQKDESIRYFSVASALRPDSHFVHCNLGVLLANKGRLDEAIAYYKTAIRLKPDFALAHSNLGSAQWKKGNQDEAVACYRKAMEVDPKSAQAHVGLGNIRKHQGKLDEAIACYRKAIGIDPKYAKAHTGLGNVLFEQKKLDEAIVCYRKVIELDPKDKMAHNNLGIALRRKGELDEAIACHRKAIQLQADYAPAHNDLGAALWQKGQLEEAIAEWKEAIRLKTNLAVAHYNLGLALYSQKKLVEAIACYRRAIELDPKHSLAHNNLGGALYSQKKLDEAIVCYRKAIELNPKHARAHNNLGTALYDQNTLDEAIACYRRAIELDPKFAPPHNNLGNALKNHGKLDAAIACYRKAIALEPKYAPAHYNLGTALCDQNTLDEAIVCYRRAIALDPKYAFAHNNLGLALKQQGKLHEAVVCYRKAIALDPKDAMAHNNLGVALKAQNKLDDAVASYRKAIELDPKFAGAHTNLGLVLDQTGKRDEAIARYRRAIELDPKIASFHNNLARALYGQSKMDEAIACCRKAVALAPKDHRWRRNLAIMLSQRGRPADEAEAIKQYRNAAELLPNDAATQNNFAWLLATWPDPRFRDPVTAVAAAKGAVKLAPKNGNWWNTLGVAQYRNGDWKAALAALRKSTQLRANGGDAHDWLFLAMAHWQLGEKKQARAWYDKAVAWHEKNFSKQSDNHRTELLRFRAEAEALLGIPVRAEKPRRLPVAARKPTK